MDLTEIWQQALQWLTTSGLQILLIIVLTLIGFRLARVFSEKIFDIIGQDKDSDEFEKRSETLSSVIRLVIVIAISVVALSMVLGEFGIEIGPILAAAGVLGLAVGFGAQSLVKDVVTGFFILLENQIRVGDVVQIAGKGGLVEKVSLRMIILRDMAGNVHYVPNGEISTVTNMTMDYSRYVFEIGVAYRENVDEVIDVMKQIDEELRNDPEYQDDIIEPLEVQGLDSFGDSAVVIKARTTTKPIKQWRVGREFNRRLKIAFDEQNIEMPFPHQTIYFGEEKDGSAPPMHVKMEDKA
ncbi:MAG: mechanosensitive ion channel [Candidatus Marinimicrobia bacterium]|nr:mechanosensitive ion channel [Candidatus Neomarinimicrobiota bacterium]